MGLSFFAQYWWPRESMLWGSSELRPNSPGTEQDLNGTLTDDTSVKQSIMKNIKVFIIDHLMEVSSVKVPLRSC